MTPTSQKNRPITLTGGSGTCEFTIRPEDLQWTEPSRIAAMQTLGGAWVDAFGPGVATIVISGHTGWKGPVKGGSDWEAKFMELYQVAFKGWHDIVESTKDPEAPNMEFVDTLDQRCVIVAPQNFILKRSKTRPLLMQYNISFLVMRDVGAPGGGGGDEAKSPLEQFTEAMESMRNTLGQIQGWLNTAMSALSGNPGSIVALINEFFGPEVGAAVDAVLGTVNNGLGIFNTISDGLSPTKPGFSFTGDMNNNIIPNSESSSSAESVQNLMDTVVGLCDAGDVAISHLLQSEAANRLGSVERSQLMEVRATLHNAVCLFSNAFRQSLLQYPDYTPLYGASTCSSTLFGRSLSPWRDENPFELLMPVETPYVSQSVEAMHAVRALEQSDPVLYPLQSTAVAAYLHTLSSGTTFRKVM